LAGGGKMELVKTWIMDIVFVLILIAVFDLLSLEGNLKKVVNFVMGLILIVVITKPAMGLILSKGKIDRYLNNIFNYHLSDYMSKGTSNGNVGVQDVDNLKKNEDKVMLELYRKKLNENINNTVLKINGIKNAKTNVKICENSQDANIGMIKKINLLIETEDETDGSSKEESLKKKTVYI
jgi:stage III sporulation protein AF